MIYYQEEIKKYGIKNFFQEKNCMDNGFMENFLDIMKRKMFLASGGFSIILPELVVY